MSTAFNAGFCFILSLIADNSPELEFRDYYTKRAFLPPFRWAGILIELSANDAEDRKN